MTSKHDIIISLTAAAPSQEHLLPSHRALTWPIAQLLALLTHTGQCHCHFQWRGMACERRQARVCSIEAGEALLGRPGLWRVGPV